MHRNSRLKKMQHYADIYLLLNYSTYFGRPPRPSSGVPLTVVAASGTDHTIWGANFLNSPYLVTFEEACSPGSISEALRFLLGSYIIPYHIDGGILTF